MCGVVGELIIDADVAFSGDQGRKSDVDLKARSPDFAGAALETELRRACGYARDSEGADWSYDQATVWDAAERVLEILPLPGPHGSRQSQCEQYDDGGSP